MATDKEEFDALDDVPITDSVTDAGAASLRKDHPALFGEEAVEPELEPLTAEDLAAIGEEEEEDPNGDPDRARDDKGRFVPRARVDELTAQRNKERERADALQADKDAETARLAAEAAEKAKWRDFDKERDDLQAQYESNDIDAEQLTAKLKDLDKAERVQDREKTKAELKAELREEQRREREEAEQAAVSEAAKGAVSAMERFLADPENALYKGEDADKFRVAAFNQAREEIYAELEGDITWDDLNTQAKARVEDYLAGKAPTKESAADKVKRERRVAGALKAAQAASLPARPDGGTGHRGKDDEGDANPEDMSREEWNKLPQAQRDKILGRTA